MSEATPHEAAARNLRRAYTGKTLQPMRDVVDETDEAGAYQIQQINTDFWLSNGRTIAGRKIGLTAKAVQEQLGVDQPDYGMLFADMEVRNGETIDTSKLIQPKAEAEIAFILSDDLPAEEMSVEQLASSIEHACAAIEIVDSRIADWKITFADTVADNGSSAMYVLGKERLPLDELDLTGCKMALTVDGETVSTGVGAACLGNPLNAALWLVNRLASMGQPMKRGQVILSGALGPMVALEAGTTIAATIDGLGDVSFTYGDAA